MSARTVETPAKTAAAARAETVSARVRDGIVRWGFVAVTLALFLYFAGSEETFRQSSTLLSMLKFISVTAIVGLGVTVSMAVGGLDLSVGGVAGMAVTLAAMLMVIYAYVGTVAIGAVLAAGALVGLTNGVLIVKFKIPDLLATLGMMFVIMGLKLVFVDGRSVSTGMRLPDGTVATGQFTQTFLWLDDGQVGPIPAPVLIFLVLTVATWFFLTRTRWGRMMYAVGANAEAARLAGVNVNRYRFLAYAISGVFASIGGMILAARIGQGDISAGSSLLLDSVAVALVGTSVLGLNRPNAWGTALGAVLLGVTITGLTIKGFPYYAQDVVKGVVLLIALVFSFTLSRKRARTKAVM